MRFFLPFILGLTMFSAALAVDPDERLEDPEQEARAQEISRQLRCVVCQNQSIDESDASLARDLRRLVRERIEAGDSNAEVKTYVVERYGEFVLLRPRFDGEGIVLWLAPIMLLLAGGGLAIWFLRRRTSAPVGPEALSREEVAELMAVLNEEETGRRDPYNDSGDKPSSGA